MSSNNIPKPKGIDSNSNVPEKISSHKSQEPDISFSFQYWQQTEYFGLDTSDIKWFVSLLDCLNDLSNLQRSDLDEKHGFRERFRYHFVKWNATNVPIQRKDLDWLPDEILNNDEDFPLRQLSITTGNGRFAGFWGTAGEETVFHIVLLDPEHNLQPSKDYNYDVDPCGYVANQFADLHRRADNLIDNVNKNCTGCRANAIAQNFQNHNQERALISFLPTDYNDIMDVIDREDISENSIDDIVFRGLLQIIEEND